MPGIVSPLLPSPFLRPPCEAVPLVGKLPASIAHGAPHGRGLHTDRLGTAPGLASSQSEARAIVTGAKR